MKDGLGDALRIELARHVGETLAAASVLTQCQKLGFDTKALSAAQAQVLVAHIGKGLNVFLGRSKSETVCRDLLSAVEARR